MNRIFKRVLFAVIMLIFPLSLCSCMDLGDVDDEAAYGEDFSVSFIESDNDRTSDYEVNEFFNEDTTKNMECPIDADTYKYMFIQNTSGSDVTIEDFYMYMDSDKNQSMQIKVWVGSSSDLPTTFADMDKNYKALKDYLEKIAGGEEATLTIEVDDGPTSTPVSSAKYSLKKEQKNWNDLTVRWSGAKTVTVPKDDYLIFQFVNNTGSLLDVDETTTLEEFEQMIQERKDSACSIRITNIIIEMKKDA